MYVYNLSNKFNTSKKSNSLGITAKQNAKYIPRIITIIIGGIFSIDMLRHKIPVHYIERSVVNNSKICIATKCVLLMIRK
jgi:hypothetical protein